MSKAAGNKDLKCPDYAALLGHFARVSIERDYVRARIEGLKEGVNIEASELERLLKMLGKILFNNKEKLTGNVTVASRNNLIWRRILDLRRMAGERPIHVHELDEFSDMELASDGEQAEQDDGVRPDRERRNASVPREVDAYESRPASKDSRTTTRQSEGEARPLGAEANGAP